MEQGECDLLRIIPVNVNDSVKNIFMLSQRNLAEVYHALNTFNISVTDNFAIYHSNTRLER